METNEEINSYGASHRNAQWVVTGIFFIILILQLLSSSIYKHYKDVKNISIYFYLLGFTPSNPLESEKKIHLYLYFVIFILFLITFLFACSYTSRKYTFVVSFFGSVWFFITPVLFFFINDIVVQSFYRTEGYMHINRFFAIVVQIIQICFIAVGVLLSSIYCKSIPNIFVTRGTYYSLLILIYYFEVAHCASPFIGSKLEFLIVRCIFASIALVGGVVLMPYLTCEHNCLFIFAASFDLSISIFQFTKFSFLFQTIISSSIALILVLIIRFVLIPILYKSSDYPAKILTAFFMRKYNLCNELLSYIKLVDLSPQTSRTMIQIGFEVGYEDVGNLIEQFKYYEHESIQNNYFIWVSEHCISSQRGILPAEYQKYLFNCANDLSRLTNEFWHQAWLSNLASLSQISSEIGRIRVSYAIAINDLRIRYPNCVDYENREIEHLVDDINKNGHLFYNIQWIDIFSFVSFIVIILSCIFATLVSVLFYSDIGYSLVVKNFAGALYRQYDCTCDLHPNLTKAYTDYLKMAEESKGLFNILQSPFEQFKTLKDYFDYVNSTEVYENFTSEDFFTYFNAIDQILLSVPGNLSDTHKEIDRVNNIFSLVVIIGIPLIFIICILIDFILRFKTHQELFKNFLTIPYSRFGELASTKLEVCQEDMIAVVQQEQICSTFKSTFIYYALHVFLILLLAIIRYTQYLRSKGAADTSFQFSKGISMASQIPLWISSTLFSRGEDSYEFIKGIINADEAIDLLTHEHLLQDFMNCVPDKALSIIGKTLIYSIPPGWEEIGSLVTDIEKNFASLINEYESFKVLPWIQLLTTLVSLISAFVVMTVFQRSVGRYVGAECDEGKRLFEEAAGPVNDRLEPEQLSDLSLNLEGFDVTLFVIRKDGSFIFRTRFTQSLLTGESIYECNLPLHIQSAFKSTLEGFEGEYTTEKRSIAWLDENKSLVLSPVYEYRRGGVFVKHIICVEIPESPTLEADIASRLEEIFYRLYPSYIPLDQEFPLILPSKLKNDIFILIFLEDFQRWSIGESAEAVQGMRREISQVFFENCRKNENFMVMAEYVDMLFAKLDREKAKVSVWHIHEEAADFAEKNIDAIKMVIEKYDAKVRPRVVLYKCREPDVTFTTGRMELPDYGTDVMHLMLSALPFTEPDSINYITNKVEMKLPRTAKVRTCYTQTSEKIDVYIIV